jgi:hypothetical protein
MLDHGHRADGEGALHQVHRMIGQAAYPGLAVGDQAADRMPGSFNRGRRIRIVQLQHIHKRPVKPGQARIQICADGRGAMVLERAPARPSKGTALSQHNRPHSPAAEGRPDNLLGAPPPVEGSRVYPGNARANRGAHDRRGRGRPATPVDLPARPGTQRRGAKARTLLHLDSLRHAAIVRRSAKITGAKPKQFAYTLNNKPLIAGPYTPVPPGVNFNSLGAINTIERSGFGESLIQFRRVGILPDTVLVSAASKAARVCNLNTQWVTTPPPISSVIVRDVVCYQVSGVMTPTISFVTYTH